jgi:hypothetical protein
MDSESMSNDVAISDHDLQFLNNDFSKHILLFD